MSLLYMEWQYIFINVLSKQNKAQDSYHSMQLVLTDIDSFVFCSVST